MTRSDSRSLVRLGVRLRFSVCGASLTLSLSAHAGTFIDGFGSAATDTARGVMCVPMLSQARAVFEILVYRQTKSGDLAGAREQSHPLFQMAYRAEALRTFAAKSHQPALTAAQKAMAEDKEIGVMSAAWRKHVDECILVYDRLVTEGAISQADESAAIGKARRIAYKALDGASPLTGGNRMARER